MKLGKILGAIALVGTIAFTTNLPEAKASDDTIRDFNRIAGDTRYVTSVQVSKEGWTTANTVVLASGENFPDALAGGPLAKNLDAPILLTKKGSLPSEVLAEIKRLGAKKVVILGGTGSVAATVETALRKADLSIDRIAGENRYQTAEKIAERLPASKAVVANGANFADSLAVAAAAAEQGMPILLTQKDKVSFTKKHSTYTVIGGTAAVSDAVKNSLNATRISGKSRYETSAAVVAKYYGTKSGYKPVVTSGEDFPDALTGSVLAAKKSVPVLLVAKEYLPAATKNVIETKKVPSLKVVGGKTVVTAQSLGAPKPVVVKPVANPKPTPPPAPTAPAVSDGQKLVNEAKKYIGTRYVFGGKSPSGFDCSGFIWYVHQQAGIKLGYQTAAGYASMTSSTTNPQVGDVVFFSGTYKAGVSHMGIYVGNNSFIHTSTSKGVTITKLPDVYWSKYSPYYAKGFY
ncbi:cell wall-binding repeat-containing protein [Chryseomicrobium palamuruense]